MHRARTASGRGVACVVAGLALLALRRTALRLCIPTAGRRRPLELGLVVLHSEHLRVGYAQRPIRPGCLAWPTMSAMRWTTYATFASNLERCPHEFWGFRSMFSIIGPDLQNPPEVGEKRASIYRNRAGPGQTRAELARFLSSSARCRQSLGRIRPASADFAEIGYLRLSR